MKHLNKNRILVVIVVLMLLLATTLCACGTVIEEDFIKLDTPTNIRVEENAISWDGVANALEYIVCIKDDVEYSATKNFLLIKETAMSQGSDYKIRVMAKGDNSKYINSNWSETLNYTYGANDYVNNFSSQISTYKGVQTNNGLELANSININDKYYLYYFKLGTILNCPIYSSVGQYYTKDNNMVFEFEKCTESGITNSFLQASETINTHSYTGGYEVGFEEEVNFELEIDGIKLGGAKFSESGTSDSHWTDNWGNITTATNSRVDSYLETYKQGYSVSANFSEEAGFEKGKYYRLSFYEPLISYGILIYDVETNSYSVSYQEMMVDNNMVVAWDESDDGLFTYSTTNNLEFDVNKAVEYAEQHKEDLISQKNEVIVDLRSCFTYDKADLDNFSDERYNNGVFTLGGAYKAKKVDKYIFRGAYGLANSNGNIIRSIIEGLSIRILSEKSLEIAFENMAFAGKAGYPAIYRDYSTENKNFNDTIISSGLENVIYGRSLDKAVIHIKNFTIAGTGELGVYAANNSNDNGAAGILCEEMQISTEKSIKVLGGNAGNGGIGGSAIECEKSLFVLGAGELIAQGGIGGSVSEDSLRSAGNGGVAIASDKVYVDSDCVINIKLIGGNGGNAECTHKGGKWNKNVSLGSGGRGGNGITSRVVELNGKGNISIIAGNGGDGANQKLNWTDCNGGNGGNGANAIYASESVKICMPGKLKSGNGGNGGIGGDEDDWGYGSNGGDGGSSEYVVNNNLGRVSFSEGVVFETGSAGNGGRKGYGKGLFSKNGKAGLQGNILGICNKEIPKH